MGAGVLHALIALAPSCVTVVLVACDPRGFESRARLSIGQKPPAEPVKNERFFRAHKQTRTFADGDLGLSRKSYTKSQHFPMPTLRCPQAGVTLARKRRGLAH